MFVSRWHYKSDPLNMIGQFNHDGSGWWVSYDSSSVSQIGRVLVSALLSRSSRSPFVGFVG